MKNLEPIKTLILTVLFISMVSLAGVYIVNTQRLAMYDDTLVDPDRLLIIREDGGELTEYDRALIMPEAVCYSVNGNMKGCIGDASIISDMYAALGDTLRTLLGPASFGSLTSDGQAVWDELASCDDLVYIKYHTPLPAPVIYAALIGGTVSSPPEYASGDTINIRELIIKLENISADHYDYTAAARDASGNVLIYTPSSESELFDMTDLTVFESSKSVIECEFYGTSEVNWGGLAASETALVFESNIVIPSIKVRGILEAHKVLDDGLLKLFGYNPDRLNMYRESEDSAVYVETHGILRVSNDLISYESADGIIGIDVASLLGYESYSANYNVYELLCASGEFIRRIKAVDYELLGGNASLVLTGLEYSGTAIRLDFGLTYEGMLVCGADNKRITAVQLLFCGGYITEASVTALCIEPSGESVMNFPQSWSMSNLASQRTESEADDSTAGVSGDVHLCYIADGSEICMTDWVYVYRQ